MEYAPFVFHIIIVKLFIFNAVSVVCIMSRQNCFLFILVGFFFSFHKFCSSSFAVQEFTCSVAILSECLQNFQRNSYLNRSKMKMLMNNSSQQDFDVNMFMFPTEHSECSSFYSHYSHSQEKQFKPATKRFHLAMNCKDTF